MSRGRDVSRAVAAAITWLAAGWTLVLLVTGGFDGRWLHLSVSAHDARRPALWSALALSVFILIGGEDAVVRYVRHGALIAGRTWRHLHSFAVIRYADYAAAIALSIIVVVIGGMKGIKAVGGSDSYGFVSEAELWLNGRVSVAQHWVKDVPWPDAMYVASPLGYRPGPDRWLIEPPLPHGPRDPWTIVPTYSPGLPLLMAGAKLVAGQSAMFWIPPLGWGVLVLATFGIGLRLGSRIAGLVAAWLVATSPNVMDMAQSMMSDVPVAAAWAAAYWALLGSTLASGITAAIAVAIAILIKPNLFFMAGAMLLIVACQIGFSRGSERRRQIVRGLVFITGIGAGMAGVAAIYWATNGSPFVSGYGSLSEVMHWQNVVASFSNFVRWFVKVHTVFALAGIAALFLPLRALWPGVRHRVVIPCLGLFVAGVWLAFMTASSTLETEFYLRLLLPTWPFIMLGVARTMLLPAGFGPIWFRRAVTVAVLVVAARWGWQHVPVGIGDGPFTPLVGERRFATAGVYARQFTPENSVIFSLHHSGSIRYYGGRVTLRFDLLPAGWMDRSLAWLADHGVHPYLLIETWEQPQFDARFAVENVRAALLRPPLFRFEEVELFDLLPDPKVVTPTTFISEQGAISACLPPAPEPTLVFKGK